MNFIEKLKGQQEIFLNNVKYEMAFAVNEKEEAHLMTKDELAVSLENNNIKVIFSREVKTEPFELFIVNVAMGCLLPIKEEYLDEKWDIAELERAVRGERRILTGLISRVSLLISQITSSYGQRPIITPPNFMEPKNEEDKN